jgi:hypothetical protein
VNRATLKRTRALFQALPAGSTLSAADVPAFPDAKKSAWLPFDERCVPAVLTTRLDRWSAPEIALPQLPSRPGPEGPKLKTAIPWESVEAGEESCGCREEQGFKDPSVNALGWRLRETLLSSPF